MASWERKGLSGPDADRSRLVRLGRGNTVEAPIKLVHEAFRHAATKDPSNIAAVHEEDRFTYAELEFASSNLSRSLIGLGLRPREKVVLLVQRSLPMIVAMIAVLKCGCQYIPMDGGVASDDALAHVLSETEPPFILCLERYIERAQRFVTPSTRVLPIETVSTDDPEPDLESGEKATAMPDDGAYIIYTSGSTGKPKGVDVSHRNVTNLLTMQPGNLGIKPGRKVAQLLSISFDMAVWEILGTLMNGGTLYIRTSDWNDTLQKVDTIIVTPSILATLKENEFRNIKTIALAGEPCPLRLADEWADGRNFYNCCGPTEVTIVNTMHQHVAGQALTIGRPVPNTSVYILDEQEEPVPVGAPGMMWVGGSCVSRGYFNMPDLTHARYVLDKFQRDGSVGGS